MNRTALVFVLTTALLSPLYAVDVIDQTIVGTNGLPGEDAVFVFGAAGPHTISGSELTGGTALSITDPLVSEDAYGGAGARFALLFPSTNKVISVDSSILEGGQGSDVAIDGALALAANAYGGDGFLTTGGRLSSTDSQFYGGDGGSIVATSGSFDADVTGGNGIEINDGLLELDTGWAAGGQGGNVTTSGTPLSTADGGNGVSLITSTFSNSVVGSTLIGGDGGTADNGTGSASADGGAGLFVKNVADITLIDSDFIGGTAGVANGVAGVDGASIEIQGSTVSIIGGELTGELLFSGNDESTIQMQGTIFNDAARQTGGIVNVNDWDPAHFQNTTVSDGTMIFSSQMFSLQNGSQFALESATAAAQFNDGFTVLSGGVVNAGLGTLSASTVIIGDDSQISTAYDGAVNGVISSAGSLTIGSGTTWTINAGTNAVAVDQTFDIATAAGAITNNITAADMILNGSGGEAGWLGGIRALEDVGSILRATYGAANLDVALGVDGDTSTEYGKAVADLTDLLTEEAYTDLAFLVDTAEEAGALITNSYVRVTEMANTLIGLQSIFSEQVKDRTRSYQRHQEVGYPAAPAPEGSAGWKSMRMYSDRMEDRFGYDNVMDPLNEAAPRVSYDEVKDSVDNTVPDARKDSISLPPTYQTWGRGYGSFTEQDSSDGFGGYDATIGGGILGLDKQIDNMLVGIAGGYARTVLEGNTGKDGKSDTGHAVAYFSVHGDHAFLDASANYAYNDVETEYDTLGYTGDYAAHTVGLYLGGGYVFSIADRILLIPEASILNTLYSRDGYTESSDLYPDLMWDSYDTWSYLGSLGATLSMLHKVEFSDSEVAVQPEFRAHLLHEFNDEFDNETYTMVQGTESGTYNIGASLKPRDEDLIKLGAGVRLSKWSSDTTEFGLDVDGTFGDNYNAYVISGKILHRF